ncbi:NADH dehydrogenase subunit [Natrarchaeobius halalkaliphilus]|uniref:NADH dehydrogenase subunit n=1 Tax=Natrarchaeobius halalkaliphilus TaxID=1679091 RepID=A0A3N6LIT4_9EURY|nr:NADH dehydrogenase subunit [Natrarchaeobius halalkaliphilus]RQG87876.1 NADH dehydrogenase subunit [Natrarchaeobius halalkaliphilus]
MAVNTSIELDPRKIPDRLYEAGVAGAGGAGFPSGAKWEQLEDVHSLLVNHQESEPNYYSDVWLGTEHAAELAAFFDAMLEADLFERIVVGTKQKYRDEWTKEFETACDADVYLEDELPPDLDGETGIIFAYTGETYDFSEEQVLLMMAAGERIGRDLPTDHGWIVHNTETLWNIYNALAENTPVTRKYVHVGGDTPAHRCLDVPVGTTAADLLEAADLPEDALPSDAVLADGGPGWSYAIDESPVAFGTRKRTNAILVLDEATVEAHTEQEDRINVLEERDWNDRDHETQPSVLEPETVSIPLITNAAYEGLVTPGDPVVEPGDRVSTGDVVARRTEDEISNNHHASIDGTVVDVTETHVVLERE